MYCCFIVSDVWPCLKYFCCLGVEIALKKLFCHCEVQCGSEVSGLKEGWRRKRKDSGGGGGRRQGLESPSGDHGERK